jgi:hypothetical protein
MLLLAGLPFTRVSAQNYLTQDFESSTFPPSSWTLTTPSGSYSDDGGPLSWARQTSYGASYPSIAAHGGNGMAWFNSWDISSGGESILITPAMNFSTYTGGLNQVSFWYYNISGYSDYMNVIVNTAASASGSGATTLASISLSSAGTGWHQYTYSIPSSYSSSSTVYIIFDAHSDYQWDENIDDISIDHIPPCSGVPGVALIPAAGNISICAGGHASLSGAGTTLSTGQVYQWQQSSSATGPWTNIAGATNTTVTTGAISTTTYFRLKDSCTASGGVGYSAVDTVGPGSPAYAALPYVQDFENWQNYCTTYDVPGGNWANSPSSGDGSWRRDDQGCSYGGWTSTGCYTGTGFYTESPQSPYSSSHGGSHSARFHGSVSYGYLSSSGAPWSGNLDLYVNCSGSGNKLLQFFFKSQNAEPGVTPFGIYNNDSLDVFLSTNGGTTFTQIWGADTAQDWKKIRLEIPSTSATTVIRFTGKRNGGDPAGYGYTYQYSDIGLDSVYVGPSCTTVPSSITVSPSGTVTGCPGASYSLNIGGLPLVGGLTYQWKQSVSPFSSFTNAVGGSGATTYNYTTPSLFDSIMYETVVSCPSTSSSATSAVTTIAFSNKPTYAAINLPAPAGPGYHYSFENWNNRCSSYDAPVVASGSTASNWANYPSTGNNSWRRDDQGNYSGYYYTSAYSPYLYSPTSVDSSHSARRYTYYFYGSPMQAANLYLFLDCSTVTGGKELQYFVNTNVPPYSGSSYSTDTLTTWLSTDGGATFTMLRQDFNGNGSWQFANVPIPSNSAKTVINFQSTMSSTYSYEGGVGLDAVKVLLPCSGKPTAGTLTAPSPCPNKPFTMQLTGTSAAAGLFYEWQTSSDGFTWTDAIGDTSLIGSFNFSSNTYVRCIVKCKNSGLADTSAGVQVILKPFYKCYCNPRPSSAYIYGAIGNFSILRLPKGDSAMDHNTVPFPILSNSWAQSLYSGGSRSSLNGYTNFQDTLAPSTIYLDSLYRFYITEVSALTSYYGAGYPINVYIDYDHSGTFDAPSSGELVFNKTVASASAPTATDTFRVPDNAMVGITGMRALVGIYQSSPMAPCGPGSYSYGEIRDYLINIDYKPCNGPVNAGTAISTDTIMCRGYSYTLTDTTHEYHQSGISWNWQYSPDGVTWGDMPGTANRDTISQTFTGSTTWYRMQMICAAAHDTTHSASVQVKLGAAYQCYCFSEAVGGIRKDSSDIGAFTFGSFVVNKKGPHILNPAATGSHTNYTGNIIELDVDSTYPVGLYHILRSSNHGDAKVTLFIDYNNNLSYDVPTERVWTAYTSAYDWYITTAITIPDIVITDVPTGMRLILNNNVGANAPSDQGCGEYTSGETMDFAVKFNRPWATGVGILSNLQNLAMYPNPSDGKFKVSFSSQQTIRDFQISISNMTGQQVYSRSYTGTKGQFNTEIDLGGMAKGVYFVTFMADGERMIRKMVIK